ncbi:MAG: hypothetical protein HYY93_11025 [Planctomycetes bacterium]|nr:hypothetical protein [Planctomycetota bacterium]
MTVEVSSLVSDAIRALNAREPREATTAFGRLESFLRESSKPDPAALGEVWDSFILLLGRRGYFVSNAEELAGSLDEIHATGLGFDLYELAAAIARCDATLTECRRTVSRRMFPALEPFTPPCKCGGHHHAP